MHPVAAALLAAPLAIALAAAPAVAQNGPSAAQIIQSLKPTGGMTTRGIHPIGPDTGTAAPPASGGNPGAAAAVPHRRHGRQTATTAPMATGESPAVNLTVQFRTGSAGLTPAATHTLDELGRALSSPTLAGYHFRIEGHTDTVGSPELNKRLSQERADKVVDYLAAKFGVDKSRLEAIGMGEEGLLVQTPDQTAEPRNRRVTVVNVGT